MSTKTFCLKTASFGLIGGLVLSAVASVSSFAASDSVHITNEMVRGSKPILKTTDNVGGGVWDYGTCIDGFQKKCWSNYLHATKNHGSTAMVGTQSSGKVPAYAGDTSYASAHGGYNEPTHAYWDNDVYIP